MLWGMWFLILLETMLSGFVLLLFRYGTWNGRDYESYNETEIHKWLCDVTPWIEGCDHDAPWIDKVGLESTFLIDVNLELVFVICSTMELRGTCMVNTPTTKSIKVQDNRKGNKY